MLVIPLNCLLMSSQSTVLNYWGPFSSTLTLLLYPWWTHIDKVLCMLFNQLKAYARSVHTTLGGANFVTWVLFWIPSNILCYILIPMSNHPTYLLLSFLAINYHMWSRRKRHNTTDRPACSMSATMWKSPSAKNCKSCWQCLLNCSLELTNQHNWCHHPRHHWLLIQQSWPCYSYNAPSWRETSKLDDLWSISPCR